MKMDRRAFLGSALGVLAVGGCRSIGAAADVPTYGFKWIDLVHLGMNMWGDLPRKPERKGIMTKILTDAGVGDNQILTLYYHEGFSTAEFAFVHVLKAVSSQVTDVPSAS